MNKIYGYARISRKEQSVDRQIRNIRAACPVEEIATQSEMEKARFHRLREGKHIPTWYRSCRLRFARMWSI